MSSSTIWKYPLPLDLLDPDDAIVHQIPEGAETLTVGVDPAGLSPRSPTTNRTTRPGLAIWLAVDPDAPREARRFRVVGTGWEIRRAPIEVAALYVGSVIDRGFAWHVLDLGAPALDPGGPGPRSLGDGTPEVGADG